MNLPCTLNHCAQLCSNWLSVCYPGCREYRTSDGSPGAVDGVKYVVPGVTDRRAVITNGCCLLNTLTTEPMTLFVDHLLQVVRGCRLLRLILTLALFSVATSGMAAPVPAPPEIKAKSWVLMDHNSGRILAIWL